MVVERAALIDAVRDVAATQSLLHSRRLGIGAVEDDNLVPLIARLTQSLTQSGGNHLALLPIGRAAHNLNLLAAIALREALLLHTA